MKRTEINSAAFKAAALQSEKHRVAGILWILVACVLIISVRYFATDSSAQDTFIRSGILFVATFVYEVFMYRFISRSIAAENEPAPWIWNVNLFVEILLPTGILFNLITGSLFDPYQALVTPAGLLFTVFIILSTLRLTPLLSHLTGLYAALGYFSGVAYTYNHYPAPESGAFTLPIFLTYGTFLLLSGFVAGGVAGQIRKHVVAALKEAETKREMDRIKQDLDIARSIQQGLLPDSMPSIEGFEIAAWNKPADETGGDYYDWQQLAEGRLAFSLADVSGHGIGPALVTAVCRAYARASFPSESGISSEMSQINDLLVADLPPDKFVTFVVAVLDPKSDIIRMLSAGHAPLMLYTAADNQVQIFAAHGIPFGLMPGVAYGPPQDIQMASGDMLVLITDGFTEWMNLESEEFGDDRLAEVIKTSAGLPPADIISALYAEVLRYAGPVEQSDDLTAIIVKRT